MSKLELVVQPQAYFHELVTDALSNLRLSTQPETEFYLVNLLNQFMTTDNLFPRDAEGHPRNEALALLVKDALEQNVREHQKLLFRQVGDVSLYISGYFQESFSKKLVDVDYYIEMGGVAYGQVAERAPEDPTRAMYQELSERFPEFVEVLASISEKTTPKTEKDLLRTYERWLETKSERAAKILHGAGIIPGETLGKKNPQ